MPNVRHLNQEKYKISKNRFREIFYYCLQYKEWKEELQHENNTVKSIQMTGMPLHSSSEDATVNLAIRRAELQKKCDLIEGAAVETDKDLHQYILKAVTEDLTFSDLKSTMNIPCERDMYYDLRRKFYWIMDKLL